MFVSTCYDFFCSGAQLVLHSSSPDCQSNCRNNETCRQNDCQLLANQEMNITCQWMGGACNSSTPVSIHRIDAVGDRVIRGTSGHRVMPGFERLEKSREECWVRLTFITTTDANGVVLQCAILHTHNSANHKFSRAHVLSVKGMYTQWHVTCKE